MDKEHEAAAHAYRSSSSVLHEGSLTVMDTERVELMTFQSPDRDLSQQLEVKSHQYGHRCMRRVYKLLEVGTKHLKSILQLSASSTDVYMMSMSILFALNRFLYDLFLQDNFNY